MSASGAPRRPARPSSRHRRAPGRRELFEATQLGRRPPPQHPLPLLELRPAQWQRPGSYITVEDLVPLRDIRRRFASLIGALGASLRRRGRDLLPVSCAQLLVHYAFRGTAPFGDPLQPLVASPGFWVPNATWAEILGYERRQVIRGWQDLAAEELVVREIRQVALTSLNLTHPDGRPADGFLDAAGRPHYEVQLPSVSYLTLAARCEVDAAMEEIRAEHCLADDLLQLVALVAPVLRVLARRFAPSPPAVEAQLPLPLSLKVTPNNPQQDQDLVGLADPSPSTPNAPGPVVFDRPAQPLALLTSEGIADGLRWEGGSISDFADLVALARYRYELVPQRRLDRRYRCRCGLQELEQLGREPEGAQHAEACELVGTSHPTGTLLPVRRPAFTACELLPLEWASKPSLRTRTEQLLADVFVEAARQEERDILLAAETGTLAALNPSLDQLVLPPHATSAWARKREFLLERGEKGLQAWRDRVQARQVGRGDLHA